MPPLPFPGCAPAPTKYEPKGQGSAAGAFSMPKSNRFVEPKFVPPAPNQYQDPKLPPTPSKRTAAAGALRRTVSLTLCRRRGGVDKRRSSSVGSSKLGQLGLADIGGLAPMPLKIAN